MSFILSNIYFSKAEKVGDYYISGKYHRYNNHILIFEGFLYPDSTYSFSELLYNIIEKGINIIRDLKGYFCGIYINLNSNKLFFFSDKIGYYDLFFSFENDILIISNDFIKISNISKVNYEDVDKLSLLEFLIFEYPLFNKTFIKKIKFVPLGTIIEYDYVKNHITTHQYHKYKINCRIITNIDEEIENLNKLLDNSIQKIKNLFDSNTHYGLGLSGGMDSRLVAYLALKHKMKIKSFIFGENKSDAYYVSKKIAKKLNLEHYELGYNPDFFNYCEDSIKYNPMMNVLYSWYYAVNERLPEFDVLLTGFNGDNQFGSHLHKNDINIKSNEEFFEKIISKYCEFKNVNNVLAFWKEKNDFQKVKEEIIKFCQSSANNMYWKKKEEFNYINRQKVFIKNNPSFNFFGLYHSISPFIDPDLVEYTMEIPFNYRVQRKLFLKFLRKKIPILLDIRPERKISFRYDNKFIKIILNVIRKTDKILGLHIFYKKSHKRLNRWLSNSEEFEHFLNKVFSEDNYLFKKIIDQELTERLIRKKKWNGSEIFLIFRLLTIKLFLSLIISAKKMEDEDTI